MDVTGMEWIGGNILEAGKLGDNLRHEVLEQERGTKILPLFAGLEVYNMQAFTASKESEWEKYGCY